jgi:hypothetical protein
MGIMIHNQIFLLAQAVSHTLICLRRCMALFASADGGDERHVRVASQQQVPAVCQHCLHG